MLSAAYLASCSDDLVRIYGQLENDIISDMARRLSRMGRVSDASEWQARILKEIGALRTGIGRKLTEYGERARESLQALFSEALEKAAAEDTALVEAPNAA